MDQSKDDDRKNWSFATLLGHHMRVGTRPSGGQKRLGEAWSAKELADAVGKTDKAVRLWLSEKTGVSDLRSIERAFFGGNISDQKELRLELRDALARSKSKHKIAGTVIFKINPINSVGANWKPDPSSIDERTGYCFNMYAEVAAGADCVLAKINLHIRRDNSYAMGGSPGIQFDEMGAGFITIDGERMPVDGNYRLRRLLNLKADQQILLSISRWCRAGRAMEEEDSIWYWIDDPEQVVEIEYKIGDDRFIEEHCFMFPDKVTMKQKSVTVRKMA